MCRNESRVYCRQVKICQATFTSDYQRVFIYISLFDLLLNDLCFLVFIRNALHSVIVTTKYHRDSLIKIPGIEYQNKQFSVTSESEFHLEFSSNRSKTFERAPVPASASNFNGVNDQRSSFYEYFIPILIFNSSTVSMIVTIGYRYRWNREIVIASEKLVKRGLN